MNQKLFKYTLIALFFSNSSFGQINTEEKLEKKHDASLIAKTEIISGAEQFKLYLPEIKGKRVGVVTNQTGVIPNWKLMGLSGEVPEDIHYASIVDFLIENKIDVKKIFSPEHGFRGDADAGETVKSGKDIKTGLPIVSLYGKNKKPTQEQFADLDVILFDIQDVGARFYTYISTLHYVMETAAETGKKVIVLDRPNPNGHFVDGPVLKKGFESFVGMHPVPVVYGMTIGEYAQMINGEGWLANKVNCDLMVIPLKNYTHNSTYSLPVKPSPNLPNDLSINLYPSTCFFEAFNGSEGRGTDKPFQVYGSPYLKNMSYEFIPKPNAGAKSPRFDGKVCYGEDLSNTEFLSEINLEWLIKAHQNYESSEPFWIKQSGKFWIDVLAGTDALRKQIDQGLSEEEIKKTWQEDLAKFQKIRSKYLLYN